MTATMEAQDTQKFVALSGIGRFPRGAVFTRDQLPKGTEMSRLLSLEVCRAATDEEALLDEVALKDTPDQHESYQSLLLNKDQRIQALEIDISNLRSENRRLQLLAEGPPQESAPVDNVLISQKDKVIDELRAQNKALMQELREVQRSTRKKTDPIEPPIADPAKVG